MRILLLNPNITGALTDLLLSAGKAAAAPGTHILNNREGGGQRRRYSPFVGSD